MDRRQEGLAEKASAIQPEKTKVAWFHCASLGEFEQGRPVIEAFRKEKPEYKILLTFFLHRDMKSGKITRVPT